MLNEDGEEDMDLLIRRKIDAISWLIYENSQRDEAVYQVNALTRHLVAMEKFDFAKDCSSKIPEDITNVISSYCSIDGELSNSQSNTLSENSNFTEKVAYEQKLKQYNVELERWQSNQE